MDHFQKQKTFANAVIVVVKRTEIAITSDLRSARYFSKTRRLSLNQEDVTNQVKKMLFTSYLVRIEKCIDVGFSKHLFSFSYPLEISLKMWRPCGVSV